MSCEKIKELIMTDYIDGQLGTKSAKGVQEHLRTCSRCRQFELGLLKAIEPFKNLKETAPPDFLWEKIKENITETQQEGSIGVLAILNGYLRALFNARRPVVVFATVVVIFITTAVITNLSFSKQRALNAYFQEQTEFLASLDTDSENSSASNHTEPGTSIEEYLL